MPPALRETLVAVARRLDRAHDPWWIVTGAAVALHGLATPVGDVDVLVGAIDAARLLGPGAAPGSPNDRYRSALFGRIEGLPLPVEVMAGLDLFVGDCWRPVRFTTREAVMLDGAMLFVPARDELAALLRSIGRPKDLARAVMLAS